ncbi:MAG: GntR family transcriptional regulator [Chlorobiales bacterium]|nr:GntR family transcriptional regulator [Chlorobiales bacterium]
MRKIRTVKDLKGEVYKILRQAIADGSLAPGERLKETELVRTLDVSRTPIREALNQLSKDGFVDIIPRKGTFVKLWTLEEALEILLLREVLEGLAARLATTRLSRDEIDKLAGYLDDYEQGRMEYVEADRRFHEDIAQACGMTRLIELIQTFSLSFQVRTALTASFNSPGRIKASIAEHRKIIEAIRTRDENLVERVTRENFRRTRDFYSHFQQGDETLGAAGGKAGRR